MKITGFDKEEVPKLVKHQYEHICDIKSYEEEFRVIQSEKGFDCACSGFHGICDFNNEFENTHFENFTIRLLQRFHKNFEYKYFIEVDRKNFIEANKLFKKLKSKEPVVMNVGINTIILKIEDKMIQMDAYVEGLKDYKIAFNPKYFLDVLKLFKDKTINIYMDSNSNKNPIMILQENKFGIVLPVRIPEC